jgi:hypothetical protein
MGLEELGHTCRTHIESRAERSRTQRLGETREQPWDVSHS